MGSQYGSIEEFRQDVEMKFDIEFRFKGIEYTVLSWTDGGPTIGRQNSDEDFQFPDFDAMVDGYKINGVPLRQLVDQIEILLH